MSEKAQTPDTLVAPGQIIAGKYRVDRVLGKGGMGVVVAAHHLQLAQLVAIKIVLPEVMGSPVLLQRFVREARAVAQLRSEHVIRVHDVGQLDDGAPFMVMEYLVGADLYQVMKDRGGTLSVPDAAEYVLQACEAMAEAHARGIIHRDLKPQNLFLTQRADGSPLVKVLDFGVAKAADDFQATTMTALLGSPAYMAPEQMRGAATVDTRADIYAIGAILYALVTGGMPFKASSLPELCVMVMSEPPDPPSNLRPDLPPEFEAVILRCLAKAPDDRYADVAQLAHALAPLAPLRARPLAETAERVLSRAAVETPLPLSGSMPAALPVPAAAPSMAREKRVTMLDAAVAAPQTQAAAPPMQVSATGVVAPPPRRSRAGLVVGGLAIAAAAGGAVIWSSRTKKSSADDDERTSQPSVPGVHPAAGSDAGAAGPATTPGPARAVAPIAGDQKVIGLALSADGARMAYVADAGLFVRDTDGGDAKPVEVDGGASVLSASWYPDGKLLVAVDRPTGPALVSVTAGGGAGMPVAAGSLAGAVSPDGRTLARVTEKALVLVDSSGAVIRASVPLEAGEEITALAWSPDSSRLGYLLKRERTIKTISSGGGDPVVVATATKERHFTGQLAWSKAGLLVAVSGAAGAAVDLVKIDSATGQSSPAEELVPAAPGAITALGGSADGAHVAMVRVTEQKDVLVAELGGKKLGALRHLTTADREDFLGAWSAGGDEVFYLSAARGAPAPDVQRVPVDGGDPQLVAPGDAPRSDLALMPGGEELVYWRPLGGKKLGGDVVALPVGGGAPRALWTATATDSIRCGKAACFAAERRDEAIVLTRFGATGGAGEPVNTGRVSLRNLVAWDVDADGKQLVAVGADDHIRIVDLSSGLVAADIQPLVWDVRSVAFDSRGRLLTTGVVGEGADAENIVARVERDGRYEDLARSLTTWFAYLRLSPDGKRVAIQATVADQGVSVLDD